MEIWQQALSIGLALGVALAFLVIPRSLKQEAIYGGIPALILHAVGVVCFAAVIPTTIATLLLHGGFGTAFPLAIGLIITAYLTLLLFAAVEHPARAAHAPKEDVWTAEKARTSGL
jgi:uncharacterized BrkB/YihY/UPF0761 family membrane protein